MVVVVYMKITSMLMPEHYSSLKAVFFCRLGRFWEKNGKP
jgi:hypothetical protein